MLHDHMAIRTQMEDMNLFLDMNHKELSVPPWIKIKIKDRCPPNQPSIDAFGGTFLVALRP